MSNQEVAGRHQTVDPDSGYETSPRRRVFVFLTRVLEYSSPQ